jgi:NAD(P)H-dependent FMN reductase
MSRLYVVSASTRPASAGRPLAHWVTGLARTRAGVETDLIDLADVALPFLDEPDLAMNRNYTQQHTKGWSARVAAADAFVFVMPMYNGGFTAPLKNALDFLYDEWQDKPVGLISYSAGASGGSPAITMLLPVLHRLGLRPAAPTLSVPAIYDRLGPERRFLPTPSLTADALAVLDAVTSQLPVRVARG